MAPKPPPKQTASWTGGRAGILLLLLVHSLSAAGCVLRKPWSDDALTARTPADLPSLPPGVTLRVLVMGDFGTGGEGQREVAQAIAKTHASNPPDFVLTVGDNFYPRGVSSVDDPLWESAFEQVYSGAFWEAMTFYPTLGNHDVRESPEAQVRYSQQSDRWQMPDLYYSFQRELGEGASVRFLALDTNRLLEGGEVRAEELAWVDSVLSEPAPRWTVAYGHHPMLTGGWHSSSEEVRSMLLPRFTGEVALFLSGHNHSTELLRLTDDVYQGVCGGRAGRDNAYRVALLPQTVTAFSNGGWCFLHFSPDALAVELYNRVGTLRGRHLIGPPRRSSPPPAG